MGSDWQIIESGSLSPEAIMAKDAALLAQLDPTGPSLLHLYEWNVPCLTYGYFTDPAQDLNLEALERCELQKARRPTGGGIIFHLSDLAFSVLLPASHPRFSVNTLDNYAFINQKVAEVVASFTLQSVKPQLYHQESTCLNQKCWAFCMAKPTQYDLMLKGKKVGGAAQRRTKQGLLHQASLSLLPPPIDLLRQVLKNSDAVIEAMQQTSAYLLPHQTFENDLDAARRQLKKDLKRML
jgi:lipoate-protein ligase A